MATLAQAPRVKWESRQIALAVTAGIAAGILWGLLTRGIFVGIMTASLSIFGFRTIGMERKGWPIRWLLVTLMVGVLVAMVDRFVLPLMTRLEQR